VDSIARFYLIIVILVLLGAVTPVNALGFSYGSGKTVSADKINSTEKSVKPGSISIISTPSGAFVFLDGSDTGKKTPTTLQGVTAGTHSILCKKTGFIDKSKNVKVASGQITNTVISLEWNKKTGSISIESQPSHAQIFIDGQDTGKFTPGTLDMVAIGSHKISCRKMNYKEMSKTVSVQSGKTTSVFLGLEPDIQIIYSPTEIQIRIPSLPNRENLKLPITIPLSPYG
jgi:hypothetical protein